LTELRDDCWFDFWRFNRQLYRSSIRSSGVRLAVSAQQRRNSVQHDGWVYRLGEDVELMAIVLRFLDQGLY